MTNFFFSKNRYQISNYSDYIDKSKNVGRYSSMSKNEKVKL